MKSTPNATPSKSKGKTDEKPRTSPIKGKTPYNAAIDPPKSVKKSSGNNEATSESHFCSSAFLNSPDPSSLPMPVFDDDEDGNKSNSTPTGMKTNVLRQFLNIRSTPTSPAIAVQI